MDGIKKNFSSGRSYSADILKGIGIFFVVWGHTTKDVHLSSWIYSFHMPLFFILSGIFFKPEGWKKVFKRLIIPYLFFAVVSFLYWRFAEMKFRPLPEGFEINRHAWDILWQTESFRFNVPLWFLPCLFFTQIIGAFLFSKLSNRKILLIVTLVWVCLVGVIRLDLKSMWISQTLYAFPFFTIGYLIGKKTFISLENKYINIGYAKKCFAIFPLIGLYFFACRNDMMSSCYPYGYIVFFVIALLCFFCCFVLSVNASRYKPLLWLGANSLAIMCLHEPLKRIIVVLFSKVLNMETGEVRENILLSLLIAILIIVLLVPICLFLNKNCHRLLGK